MKNVTPYRSNRLASHGALLVLPAACLALGMLAGPQIRATYERLFPAPAFTTGDFGTLQRESDAPVVLFSTSTCPYCSQVRGLFGRLNVRYRDFVIDESEEARRRFDRLGGGAVPLLFIGDRRIVGFRETTIRDALALIAPPALATPTR